MKEVFLVDGYNLIHASHLKELLDISLEEARRELENILSGYSRYIKKKIIVVYDGHMVKDNRGESYEKDGLTIVFTKENETADSYIEAATYNYQDRYKMTVVTNDLAESTLAFNEGAIRLGSRAFFALIEDSLKLEKKMHEREKIKNEYVKNTNSLEAELRKWLERD